MSNYTKKAKIELSNVGFKSIEESEGEDKIFQELLFKLLDMFSEQGHSGFSASYGSGYFKKFAKYKNMDDVKAEFIRMEYKPIEECEDDPDKWIQEGTIELVKVFFDNRNNLKKENQNKLIEYFSKLSLFEPISPIMCTEDEWGSCEKWGDTEEETYQNKRCSAIFKNGKDGRPYYIDAIVWKGQNGNTFTGNSVLNSKGEKISSSQTIKKLPFEPKTFYIDVIETELADKEETVKQKDGGWWTSVVADESQLEEVWKIYENPIRKQRKDKIDEIEKN